MQALIKKIPDHYLSLAKDTSWLMALNIAQRAMGLLTTYVLVRVLSQEAYGEYNFILSIIGMFSVAALPAMDDAIMQSVSRGHLGTYRASLKIKLLFSLIGSAIFLSFGGWFGVQGNMALAYGFVIVAALFPLAFGLTQWKAFRLGQKKFSSITKLEGGNAIITSLSIVGLVLLWPGNILVPLAALLCIKALLNLFLTYRTYRQTSKDDETEEGSIRYGIRTSMFTIFGQVAMTIDKVLIFFFLSPASLAIYVAAEKIPELVKGMVKSLASALAPRFAKQDHYTAEIDRALKLLSAALFVALVLFAFTLLPWLIILIFGESYADAVPYGQALMCVVALGNMAPLKGRFFKSKLDEKSMREFLVVTSLIRIVASVSLIPTLGLNGAVISYFIARMTTNTGVHIIMKKRYPVKE